MKIFTLILILIGFFGNCYSQDYKIEDGWEGILPIHSTKSDVEKKLGTPKEVSGNRSLYETEEAVISISYSDEPCTEKDFGRWNVPKNTVLDYSVGLKAELLVSNLNWSKEKYSRSSVTEVGETATYRYSEKRISISVGIREEDELVLALFYNPAEDQQYLKCK